MNITKILALNLIGLTVSGFAFAQSPDLNSADRKQQIKDRAQIERQNFVEEIRERRETNKTDLEDRREAFRVDLKTRKDSTKADFESRREEFKNKVQSIRDERKRDLLQKINDRLSSLNERMTGQLSELVDRIEGMLQRILARVNALETEIDLADVRAAIGGAEVAIAEARSAIADQAGKIYVIDITSEEALRADAKAAKDALQGDLRRTRESVRSAHEAVKSVGAALARLRGAVE